MTLTQSTPWFLCSVIVITLWRALSSYFMGHSLYGDEAQYWFWSQELAWGYYSKPPLMAWVIHFSNALFGDSPFAVRLFPLITYPLSAVAVYLLGTNMFSKRHGFWMGLGFLTIPGISFSSFLASTDPLLLLFWSWAILFFWLALKTNSLKWWLGVGICLGLGFLTKYAMVAFLGSMILVALCSQERSLLFKRPSFWLALAIGFAFLLPNIYWNRENGFVSFVHTLDNASLGAKFFRLKYLPEFLAGQFGLMGPLLFPILCFSLTRHIKNIWQDPARQFLTLFTLPLFVFFTLKAFLSGAHPNWTAPAYLSGTMLAVHWVLELKNQRWLLLVFVINFGALAGLNHHAFLLETLNIPRSKIVQTFKSSIYWDQVAEQMIQRAESNPTINIIATDDRMMTAGILYNLRHTELRVRKWNPSKQVHDTFDMKVPLSNDTPKDILVLSKRTPIESVQRYADSVEELPPIVITMGQNFSKKFRVFLLKDFKGF